MIDVKRALVVGLGREGTQAAQELARRIRNRHGGVPIVQTLVLLFAEPVGGAAPPENDEYTTYLLLEDRAAAAGAPPGWLPTTGGSLDPDSRAQGRWRLHQHGADIKRAVDSILTRIARRENRLLLNKINLEESKPGEIHLFFVANVADPLAGGMVLDLAYLVRKLIATPLGTDFSLQAWALLMLANVPPAADEPGDDVLKLHDLQGWADAYSYAALKELDYYMDPRGSVRYRVAYPDRVGTVDWLHQIPFEHVYLINRENLAHLSLSSTSEAAAMLGEWLYQVIFTPIDERFGLNNPQQNTYEGKAGVYSSLGLSYYYLPTDDLRRYAANRLAVQLLDQRLLNAAPDDRAVNTDLTAPFRSSQDLDPDSLQRVLQGLDGLDPIRAATIARYTQKLEIPPGILPYEVDQTEERVITEYDQRMSEGLGLIESQLDRMLANKKRSFRDALVEERDNQIDDDEYGGGILGARSYFNSLLGVLQASQAQINTQIGKMEKNLAGMTGRLKLDRLIYRLAANSFGRLPQEKETPLPIFLWHARYLVVFYFVLAALVYFSWAFISTTLHQPLVAALVGILIILVAVAMSIGHYRWLLSSRDTLISRYYSRLQLQRQLAMLQRTGAFYDFAVEQVATVILPQIEAFLDLLKNTRTSFQKNLGLEIEKRLLNNPDEKFAEPILQQDDLDHFYGELVRPDIGPAWRQLHEQYGSVHSWRNNPARVPFEVLNSFCRQFAAPIGDHTISELLEKWPEDRLRKSVRRMIDLAAPFWQINSIQLDPAPSGSQWIVGLANPTQAKRFSNIVTQESQGYNLQPLSTQDEKHTFFIGDQQGLPLFAITPIMSLREHYEDRMRNGFEARLHTTRELLVVPDLLPRDPGLVDDIEPYSDRPYTAQLVVALAVALGILTEESNKYLLSHEDEDARLLGISRIVTEELGASKAEICNTLYNDSGLLQQLRGQISIALTEKAGKALDYDAAQMPDGALTLEQLRNVGRFSDGYLAAQKGHLDDWEEASLRSFHSGVLERIKSLQAAPTGVTI